MNDKRLTRLSRLLNESHNTDNTINGIKRFIKRFIFFLRQTEIVWHLVIYFLIVGSLFLLNPTTITDIHLDKRPDQSINLPYTFTEGPGTYTFQANIHKGVFQKLDLTIRADDCVEFLAVDDVPIFQRPCNLCGSCEPSQILLPNDLSPGIHRLTLRVYDFGGLGMVDIKQAHAFGWIELFIALAGGLVWLWIIRRSRLPILDWWIVMGALIFVINYHIVTDPWVRQHDVEGHREYITLIQNQHAVPGVADGWETFQPPLYYLLSTTWIKFGAIFTSADSWRWLQILSGIFYIITVAVAVFSWEIIGLSRTVTRLGLLLFAFLPAHLFLSGRINNDVMLPLWGVLVVLFLMKYIHQQRLIYLWVISFCLMGAMMTKFSGLPLLLGTVLILWLTEYKKEGRRLRRFLLPCLVILPGLLWQLFWGLRSLDQTGIFFYSNAGGLNDALRVENGASRYLLFDLRAMLTEIQFNPWGGQIRNSLPTTWIVTALFGEFNFNYLHFSLLPFLAPVFGMVCLLALIGLFLKRNQENGEASLVSLILVVAHAIFMLIYNWRYPFAPNGDFRLWAPVFFPLAVVWSVGYQGCLRSLPKGARFLAQAVPIIFLFMLGAFYVTLFSL